MAIARPKKKRRRVDVSLRIDEARAGVEALDDTLNLVEANGWEGDEENGGRATEWVDALRRLRAKLKTGLDYVVQTQEGR